MDFFDKTVNDFDLADIDLNEIDYNYLNITPFLSMAKDMDLSKIDITDMSSMFDFGDMSDLQKKLMEGYLTDDQVLAFKQAYSTGKRRVASILLLPSSFLAQDKTTPKIAAAGSHPLSADC